MQPDQSFSVKPEAATRTSPSDSASCGTIGKTAQNPGTVRICDTLNWPGFLSQPAQNGKSLCLRRFLQLRLQPANPDGHEESWAKTQNLLSILGQDGPSTGSLQCDGARCLSRGGRFRRLVPGTELLHPLPMDPSERIPRAGCVLSNVPCAVRTRFHWRIPISISKNARR
jgi:hypothetical protein